jgi:sn-glycerol 3-phosphate transport system substrate-binding protein
MKENIKEILITQAFRAVAVAALALLGGAAGAQAKIEIHFWHAMQGQRGQAVEEMVKQFNQSQGEFEVKAVFKGVYSEVLASAMVAYQQKNPPHIVQVFDAGTQSMILSDAKIPIQRLMNQQKISLNWTDFLPTITRYYSKNNKLYSMPFNTSTPILYYNRDVFRKAGLDDRPPQTWPDVEAVSQKILTAGAADCGFTTSWPSWTMLENTFAWHNQPYATNRNGYAGLDTRLLINSDFGLMHVGALAKWQQDNIYSYGGREEQAHAKFINGECAMLVASSAVIGDFKSAINFEWGTGQLPHWGTPYSKANTVTGGATLWVLRGHESADYKGVAQFMNFIAEPRQQMWWAAATGYVPITRTALKALEEDSFYKNNPEQWTAVSQLLNPKTTPNSMGVRLGNYVAVREAIELELENILAGKKTVKEGLDAAVSRSNAILRQFAVTHGAPASGEI